LSERKPFHVFLSHSWGRDSHGRDTHELVALVNEGLKQRGLVTWFDAERITDDLDLDMTAGIDGSAVFLSFLTEDYCKKVNSGNEANNCRKEFKLACLRQEEGLVMIGVPLEETLARRPSGWPGVVAMHLGSKLFPASFCPSRIQAENGMETEIDKLADRIRLCLQPEQDCETV
jgi:hypothetical protein